MRHAPYDTRTCEVECAGRSGNVACEFAPGPPAVRRTATEDRAELFDRRNASDNGALGDATPQRSHLVGRALRGDGGVDRADRRPANDVEIFPFEQRGHDAGFICSARSAAAQDERAPVRSVFRHVAIPRRINATAPAAYPVP